MRPPNTKFLIGRHIDWSKYKDVDEQEGPSFNDVERKPLKRDHDETYTDSDSEPEETSRIKESKNGVSSSKRKCDFDSTNRNVKRKSQSNEPSFDDNASRLWTRAQFKRTMKHQPQL